MATETNIKEHPVTPEDHAKHDDHAVHHHGGSLKQYWIIAVVLLAATALEVWLAEYLKDSGMGSGVVAGSMLAIALFKALLVILYYMHLRYERVILWVIFSIPFGLVSLLALAMFSNP